MTFNVIKSKAQKVHKQQVSSGLRPPDEEEELPWDQGRAGPE